MKNFFTLILFFLATSALLGQTTPIEKVEYEPDPIMMDAYDFATGKMNDVKWMWKGTFDNGPKIGFEYKLNRSISLNLQTAWIPTLIFGSDNATNFNNTMGLRYYFGHKEEIESGLRGNNLNGTYFELGSALTFPVSINFYENVFLGFGVQSRFLKRGLVDTGVKIQYVGTQNALRLSTGFALGYVFSKDYNLVEMEDNKCAIVKCYDEQFYMFKIPVSQLAFLSWSSSSTNIRLKPSFEFEHRITRVGWSLNHEISGSYELVDIAGAPESSYNYSEAYYRLGLRWYVGKKKRIIKGKTSNNLSEFYIGPVGEIGIVNGSTDQKKIKNGEFFSLGYQIGYQTRLLKKLYFNLHAGALVRSYSNVNVVGIQEMVDIRERSLYAVDQGVTYEFLPIGGLVVGYTF